MRIPSVWFPLSVTLQNPPQWILTKNITMICPFCNKKAIWCENKEIYGRNYGKSYMIYLCKPCDSYVGCHNNTKNPLGTMANRETREFRNKAHSVFDKLWNNKKERKLAYLKISNQLGYEVHIGCSNITQCEDIIKYAETRINNTNQKGEYYVNNS